MAGRFSFSVPGRRNSGDPWFRIGTLDVSTTVLVVLLCVASMFVWAADPSLVGNLILNPAAVKDGELWRLLTWPLANEPSLWTVITIAIFWYFGREIEGLLGRMKFAYFLIILTVIPGLVGVFLDLVQAGIRPIEFGVFLVFIAEYPFVRFFFGIPAWVLGAVFVGIEVLQLLGLREEEGIVFLFVTIATAALTARSMGLATSLPWIPKIPWPGSGASARRRRTPRPRSGGGDVVAGPWSTSARTGPSRGSTLPQPPSPTGSDGDQAELDALLDKISERGMDGLSSDEKRRLNELSKRMRGRK
jgi:membrane associated rhomboid family serine protease